MDRFGPSGKVLGNEANHTRRTAFLVGAHRSEICRFILTMRFSRRLTEMKYPMEQEISGIPEVNRGKFKKDLPEILTQW